MEELHKISQVESPTDEDLAYGAAILQEADAIGQNPELLKNIKSWAKKQAKTLTSIADLRALANDMQLNPAQYASEEDKALEKQKKRLAKKQA